MKINVTENKVSIKEEQILNENEYNIHKIQFDFSSEYTDDLVKVALFSIDNHTYKKIISNNECDIPPEVLTQRGYSILGVYAYKTEQDTLVLRYSPSPTKISVYDGSYKADAENSEPITPSEIEQYQQILQNSLQQFQNQYNALVEETEGDIQAIEDELQRKVDEGYFDGEDGFSPIAKVIQKSNGATIEIEDKNGKTTADVLNGEDGYTPVRGVDYWTEEDKQEVEEEATQQIEGKIEEYNENAAEKLNQYNQNSVQKTNDYNTNAEQKMSAYNTNATEKTSTYNTNATEKFNNYNSNAEQKETNYNTNASQKVESFNTNASSKLSEYNSNAETKKSAYDENATQKTNSFNTNATNKLTEYNTNHTEKMSTYNNNSTEKLNAFNENATQKTEDFDEHTEEIQDNIEILQRTDNQILSRFNKDEEVSGQDITLTGTTEIKFAKPPLPMGNSEQESTEGTNLIGLDTNQYKVDLSAGDKLTITNNTSEEIKIYLYSNYGDSEKNDWFSFAANSARTITLLYDAKAIAWLNAINGIAWCNSGETALPYEKYTGGKSSPNPDYPQEITNVTGDVEVLVENKNLLDASKGINAYISSTGILVEDSSKSNFLTDYIAIKNNQNYTLSLDLTVSQFALNYYDINKNFIERNVVSAVRKTTFSHATAKYVRCVAYQSSYQFTPENMVNTYHFQLEKGTTPTNYVEHKEQTFTFPLGNEKLMLGDYLADDGIHHVRGQYNLNGDEGIVKYINSTYAFALYIPNNIPDIKHNSNIDNIFCNKLLHSTLNNLYYKIETTGNNLISSQGSRTFAIMINNYTDINELKGYLKEQYNNGTPVKVEYELKEEVIVPYTSAQKRVYNEIKNTYSYDEMTIITGSSDGNKPSFIVQAYKDLNKELNNKVDKVQGKELSSNDFTDTLKEKLEGLENYDDTEIKADISDIQDEQTEQNTEIEKLQTENARFKATLPTTGEVTGQTITLNKTAELEFKKPPLPMGNSEQVQYSGRNLFNIETSTEDINCTKNNNIFVSNALNSYNVIRINLGANIELENGVDYYISYDVKTDSGDAKNFSYFGRLTDSNKYTSYGSLVGTFTMSNSYQRVIYKTTAEENIIATKLAMQVNSSITNAQSVSIKNIQISTSNLDYEPYVGGTASPNPDYPQEITNVTGDVEVKVQNKNLFDKNNMQKGFIPLSGDYPTSNPSFPNARYYLVPVKANDSVAISGSTNNSGRVRCIDNVSNQVIGTISTSENDYYTSNNNYSSGFVNAVITAKKDIILAFMVIQGTDTLDTFQVEYGTTATTYVAHKEQKFIFPLGNEKLMLGDYLADDGIHHVRGQIVLNGTEDFGSIIEDEYLQFYLYLNLDTIKDGNAHNIISNNYIGVARNLAMKNNNQISASSTYLRIRDDRFETVNDFKTWLQTQYNNGTPIIAEYRLAEEVIVPYTSAQQEVYNQIKQALSYEEQTNISGTSDGSNPIFNVEAYQSTKLVLQDISNAIVALGGV